MTIEDFKKLSLPDMPGVYEFIDASGQILYIGKATSLVSRVKSYFNDDLIATRGPRLVDMVSRAQTIRTTATTSVLEALILEAHLIKTHEPRYNALLKDNKSFNYVVITNEDFPVIRIVRERNLDQSTSAYKYTFGPFTSGTSLREAMKIVRRIFPYRDEKCVFGSGKPCFNYQLGLCPGTCVGVISKEVYNRTIRHIVLFFQGKKGELIKLLEKEMRGLAADQKFERAQEVKKQIFALEHINDVALMHKDTIENVSDDTVRIEAYDIAHISGTDTVGVMTVVENGAINKNEYRKFKIRKTVKRVVDDTKHLEQVLIRRFQHTEWQLPDIMVIDGGVAQLNTAEAFLKKLNYEKPIKVVSVVKDNRHKAKDIMGDPETVTTYKSAILLANSEAHRFAIAYHRQLRTKRLAR